MKIDRNTIVWSSMLCLVVCFQRNLLTAAEPNGQEFFEKKIRPVLVRYCYECHSGVSTKLGGKLRLDSRPASRKGGESGPAIVPGKIEDSILISAIRHDTFEMPPGKKLPDEIIANFKHWIEIGAPDPRESPPDPASVSQQIWDSVYAERRRWWSLQPVTDPPLPHVQNTDWSERPIDRFILARLEQQGLQPAAAADKETLIRRITFALTGLPPTVPEIESFLADESPLAYERLVDRLLDSPHFGECWARHWMDVVRYTDTYGYEWDIPAKGAWRYRDYLIRAFNRDVPYDQLVREQIAGDRLEEPRIDPEQLINESAIGTMFYQMGEKRHGDSSSFNGIHQEMLDNKIDAFSKTFQATTVACARCHDHKLDAVAQKEYYALAGSFMSSRWVTNTVDLPERNQEVFQKLKQLKSKLRSRLAALWLERVKKFPSELLAATDTAESNPWRSIISLESDKQPPLEDPLAPWQRLVKAHADQIPLAQTWKELSDQYAAETKKRTDENAAHFRFAVDFREGIPQGWSVDGVGLREIVPCGDFTVALDGDRAVGRILPGGLFTNALSPRLNGAVRTPYLNQFSTGHISFEAAGGDFAAHRTVIDNAFLTEMQTYLKADDPHWILQSTYKSQTGRHNYIEFATKTSNPNFPPRVGLGGACSDEQIADPKSWFGITRVVLHDAPFTPKDELKRFAPLFEGPPPTTLDEAATRYAAWFERSVQVWSEQTATEEDVRLVNWLLDHQLLPNTSDPELQSELASLVGQYRETERQIALPWTVNGMADLDPGYDYRLNIRGDYDQLGDEVPRGYLQAIADDSSHFTSPHSGRRELAEIIASPDNPLTAKVFVNRVWYWLFGTGIVRTPNDFGHLGDRPSHPELLDALTSRFMSEGWSLKKLVRSIVLSETWKQSGTVDPVALERDPDNRWLHHFPLRRLEAEPIRDAMLAVSGRLDPGLYGPTVNPHRAKEDDQKRLFSGPLDGDGRRSLYTRITIMEPPRLLALFNQPKPKIPTGKRDVSNTPAQSLALLNDAFVLEQAEVWARHLVERSDDTVDRRLEFIFRSAFARRPTDVERKRWRTAVDDFSKLNGVEQSSVLHSVPVWKDVAHAIYNTREFLFIR